jgi:hypothetical protein
VKTIADFSDKDRIALPAVTVSVQARILQMAAAKQWGTAEFKRLDRLTQSVPHPDATAAVIAGQTELNSHFAIRRSRTRSWPAIRRRTSCSIPTTCWAARARRPCCTPPKNM